MMPASTSVGRGIGSFAGIFWRSSLLVSLRAQPLDRCHGDYEARGHALSTSPGLQSSARDEVAHRALAHPEGSGGFLGIYVTGFVSKGDGRLLPDASALLRAIVLHATARGL